MAFKYVNFWEATLLQQLLSGATSIYIDPTEEAELPALGGGDLCRAVIYDNEQDPEIVDISAHSGGLLTIQRAKEGTSDQTWGAGARMVVDITAAVIENLGGIGVLDSFTGTATGTNDITVTTGASNSVPTPANGDEVYFQIPNDTTGPVTLSYTNGTTSIGPTAVVYPDGRALETGDLQSGWFATVKYDFTNSRWVLTSSSSYNIHAYQLNDGPVRGANLLANGNFEWWSSASSFSTPASGSEVVDGYYVEYDGTIGAFTFSRQAFTPGQTDVPGGPNYFARWNQSLAGSGSTYRRLRIKAGRVPQFAERKVIRSIYMKADSARTVSGKLIQYFGTGGGPSADVTAETVSFDLTTSWQRFELPDTLPSIAGKTLGSGNNDALILSLDLPVNTTMTIDFAMDQFESGDIATFPGSAPLVLPRPLTEYLADPLSVAELASITAAFGTAAFQNIGTSGANVPLLNAANTFSGGNTFTGTQTQSGNTALWLQQETDRALDEKNWIYGATLGTWRLATANDASPTAVAANAVIVARSGTTVTEVELNATDFDFNGNMDVSGTSVLNGAATVNALLTVAHSASIQAVFNRSSTNSCGIQLQNNNGNIQLFGDPSGSNAGSFGPSATTVDLGSDTLRWGNAYFTTMLGRVQRSATTSGALTSASANRVVVCTGNVSIAQNVFTADDVILIYAGASARTLTQTSGTQRLDGTATTGNLTIAARGWAVVRFISATEWTVSGSVS